MTERCEAEVRLRPGSMGSLYGYRERQGEPLLHHSSEGGGGIRNLTLKGLGTIEKPHSIQQLFIDEQAAQCGFCLNAIIVTAKTFLDRNPSLGRPSKLPHKVKVTWTSCTVLPRHAGIYDSSEVRRLREALLVDSKDIKEKLAEAATVLRATYNPDRL